MHLFRWLRSNSEKFLTEAAQRQVAAGYFGKSQLAPPPGRFFWRRIFVPIYRRLPWALRHGIIRAMPGSHRQRWRGFDTRQRKPGIV